MAHIGIFDTGAGGRFAAKELGRLRPQDSFMVVDDHAHLPYGSRTEDEIIKLTDAAIQPLLRDCDVIVIACNTATTIAINAIRGKYPDQRFVGFEPMIKTAAQITRSGKIAILATPATLHSPRYQKLKRRWAADKEVIEPDCSSWAEQIEKQTFDPQIAIKLATQLAADGVDIISLACTHYLKLQPEIEKAAGPRRVAVISPLHAVNQQITRTLQEDSEPHR